jgi:hypothetical protein
MEAKTSMMGARVEVLGEAMGTMQTGRFDGTPGPDQRTVRSRRNAASEGRLLLGGFRLLGPFLSGFPAVLFRILLLGLDLDEGPNLREAKGGVLFADLPITHQLLEAFYAGVDAALTHEVVDAAKAGMDGHGGGPERAVEGGQ